MFSRRSVIKQFELGFLLVTMGSLADATEPSHYAGQEAREIKALAPEEVQSFLSGKGMGLAKAAELNGYPGPSHVLALASELELSTEQRRRTEELFKQMESQAIALGQSLVHEERVLDQQFAARRITSDLLAQSLNKIGELQAQLRRVHLEAHLAQLNVLTPAQVSKYAALRGYTHAPKTGAHDGHRH